MTWSRIFRLTIRRTASALVCGWLGSVLPAADAPPTTKSAAVAPGWNLPDFVDQLPDMLVEHLPGFEPPGAVRLYVRPQFGDFLRRDFVRVPFGARAQVSEDLACSTEIQGYFTDGLRDSAGNGLSGLQLGVKYELVVPVLGHSGVSIGVNFRTPLSRPDRKSVV
jgi:hypothetical protein